MAWRDEDVVKAPIEVTWQPKEITQHRSRDQPQTMIKANLWKMDRALQNEVLQNDLPLPDTVEALLPRSCGNWRNWLPKGLCLEMD